MERGIVPGPNTVRILQKVVRRNVAIEVAIMVLVINQETHNASLAQQASTFTKDITNGLRRNVFKGISGCDVINRTGGKTGMACVTRGKVLDAEIAP